MSKEVDAYKKINKKQSEIIKAKNKEIEELKNETKKLKGKLGKLEPIVKYAIKNDDLKGFYKAVMGEVRRDKYGIIGKKEHGEYNCGICAYKTGCPDGYCPLTKDEYYIKKL